MSILIFEIDNKQILTPLSILSQGGILGLEDMDTELCAFKRGFTAIVYSSSCQLLKLS